jgi:hypothetical protein
LTKAPKTCIEEKIAFSTDDAEKTGTPACRRLKLDPYL